MEISTATVYQFGPFEAHAASGELLKQGRRIKLQEQPFRLLVILLENPGRVVTRSEIQSRIWDGHTFVDFDSSLRVAVGKLRDALGDHAENPRYIETVPKRGYRFLPAATRTESYIGEEFPNGASKSASSEAMGAVVSPAPDASFPTVEPSRRFWRGPTIALAIAAGVLVALLASGLWWYRSHVSTVAIDSVAVLPFENGSDDPSMEYLGDGIAETLINKLSQLPNLRVMSLASAFLYKGKAADARTIGKALGVRAVFEGRVVQRGDSLAISAELIDARDNSHIWGDHYDRKSSDILVLQDDIAMEIIAALRTRLTGAEEKRLAKSYTASPEAYQLYLRGRFWWTKRSEEGYEKAVKYFGEAIQKDPNYALAYAGLADCYATLGSTGVRPPRDVLPSAKEAAQHALKIDPSLVEARPSLAFIKAVYDWDWVGSEKDFQQAIVLNPNDLESHQWYGQILARLGRFDQAIGEHRKALELDPLSLVANRNLGQDFIGARRYDQAVEQLRKTIELDPNFSAAHAYLGLAYAQEGMYKDGIAELEQSLANSPGSPFLLSSLGYSYGVAGKKSEAQKMLSQLSERSKQRYVAPGYAAMIYAGLGDKEQAFASLQKAYEDKSVTLAAIGIRSSAIWDPMRADPRFANLLRRINLQP